jgi:hypothetical protein
MSYQTRGGSILNNEVNEMLLEQIVEVMLTGWTYDLAKTDAYNLGYIKFKPLTMGELYVTHKGKRWLDNLNKGETNE